MSREFVKAQLAWLLALLITWATYFIQLAPGSHGFPFAWYYTDVYVPGGGVLPYDVSLPLFIIDITIYYAILWFILLKLKRSENIKNALT